MNVVLRDYQQRAVAEVKAAWRDNPRVLLALPTGGGKTECAISLAGEVIADKRRVLIVVDRKVLCSQWRERFTNNGFDHVGLLQGENTVATWARVLVATAQTLRARGVPEDVGLVVLDESHIWHKTHDDVLAACNGASILGLSATPLREGLGKRFDKLVIGATIRELTEAGHLVPARVFAPKREQITEALAQIKVQAGDYASNALSHLMRAKAVIGDVITTWRERGENRQTIAFCVDKQHARDLADEFTLNGIPAAVIVDETTDEERVDIFARFGDRTIRVLTSVGVLGVGFDAPHVGCAILARPTLSTMLHIQQCGRVIRTHPGKVDAVILDHAANTLRHGLPIDFVPPRDLNAIERGTDKKRKDEPCNEVVVCRNCEAAYPRREDACPECGTPRTRYTKTVVLDGKLVPVEWDSNQAEPSPDGATPEDVRDFYRQMVYVCKSRGWKPITAWFKTCARFNLNADFKDPAASKLMSWDFCHNAVATEPTMETLRWIDNQHKRYRLMQRYAREATA